MMIVDGFNKVFWGLIFIFLELHIMIIDILPEPLGYYLIFSGLIQLNIQNACVKKARSLAIGLILLSIPTVFIQNTSINQFGNQPIFSSWSFYINSIGILNLILVYFLFQLMVIVAVKNGDQFLHVRTVKTFYLYMSSMLLITFLQSFTMNMGTNWLMVYSTISGICGFIMQIIFLVLVSRFKKLSDDSIGVT